MTPVLLSLQARLCAINADSVVYKSSKLNSIQWTQWNSLCQIYWVMSLIAKR